MAWVTNGLSEVSLTFQDTDKNLATTSFLIDANIFGVSFTTWFANVYIPAIALLSDARLLSYRVSQMWYETAPVEPAETSDVERKGSFTFKTDTNQVVRMEIPSIKNALVFNGTNQIDVGQPAVALYVRLMTGLELLADNATPFQPSSVSGGDIKSVASARKMHRRSSKG